MATDRMELSDATEAMLYSAEATRTIEFLKRRLDNILTETSSRMAVEAGRNTVNGDDIFAALDALGLSTIYPPDEDDPDDGR